MQTAKLSSAALFTPLAAQQFAHEPEDYALFARGFDRAPFMFRHSLDRHPALELSALLEAASRINADDRSGAHAHFDTGDAERDSWFGNRPANMTLESAMRSIEDGKLWIALKSIHRVPLYGELLGTIIDEISELAGVEIPEAYGPPTMTIFVTSPGRITPYHIDAETNFLAQIHGTKKAYLYDANDPVVLSNEELELYWTGGLPKANLPASLPEGHWQYELAPGLGIFQPAIFPHWLKNGSEVSISVSINFRRLDDTAPGVLRTNHYLRRLGLKPSPPGRSAGMDRAKQATFGRAYELALELRDRVRK